MKSKSSFMNYFGQIRVYSLVDLILLLFAFKFSSLELIGAVLLHLSFILYLEYKHKHSYRKNFPSFIWIILLIAGIILYAKIAVIGFILASFLYTKKKNSGLSPFAPLFRGLQIYFLLAGVIGFFAIYPIFAGLLTLFRNFAGDLRDIKKDKKDKMKTLPIILGFKKDILSIHLLALLITSLVWWYIAEISIVWLLIVYIIQLSTYDLTPR